MVQMLDHQTTWCPALIRLRAGAPTPSSRRAPEAAVLEVVGILALLEMIVMRSARLTPDPPVQTLLPLGEVIGKHLAGLKTGHATGALKTDPKEVMTSRTTPMQVRKGVPSMNGSVGAPKQCSWTGVRRLC